MGIDTVGSLVDAAEAAGVVVRKGSWYYAQGGQQLAQGRDKTVSDVGQGHNWEWHRAGRDGERRRAGTPGGLAQGRERRECARMYVAWRPVWVTGPAPRLGWCVAQVALVGADASLRGRLEQAVHRALEAAKVHQGQDGDDAAPMGDEPDEAAAAAGQQR